MCCYLTLTAPQVYLMPIIYLFSPSYCSAIYQRLPVAESWIQHCNYNVSFPHRWCKVLAAVQRVLTTLNHLISGLERPYYKNPSNVFFYFLLSSLRFTSLFNFFIFSYLLFCFNIINVILCFTLYFFTLFYFTVSFYGVLLKFIPLFSLLFPLEQCEIIIQYSESDLYDFGSFRNI